MRDQQSGVGHIAFLRGVIGAEREADVRIGSIKAGVDDHRLIQPDEGALVSTEAGVLVQRRQLILFLLPGELTGNSVKDGINLFLIPGGKFGDVVPIQPQNSALGFIRRRKVLTVNIGQNGLRHSAYQHILSKFVHHLSVQSLTRGFLCLKACSDQRNGRLISQRPEKFLKIQREHLDMFFF